MSEATEETFNLSYLYSLSPRLSLGSERDIILYGASCHAGARLCRSPGVSLALHPICRVLATTGRPAVRMRSPRLGPHTLLAATAQPAHRTPKGPPCLVPGRSTKPSAHRHISISFSLFAPSLFPLSSGPSPLCRHFSPFSDFPDRLRLLLWWMSLIISFQSQEEERGGSQFRTIALTGETVSPWLPRGNGAEMDSCYEHRGGDNWWCLLAQWLHSASPRWIVVSLPGWAEPLQGPHSASLTKPAEQTKCHSWSALEEVRPCAAQLLLWQCALPLLSLPFCAALPRAHTASCQTLAGQEVSLMLLKMNKAGSTCSWITAKTTVWNILYIRDGGDKEEQADHW